MEGPRIVNLDFYIQEAAEKYGVRMEVLPTWTFFEEEELVERLRGDNASNLAAASAAPCWFVPLLHHLAPWVERPEARKENPDVSG